MSNTQVTSADNNNIEVNDELTIDDGDGDESISNGNDESKHKEVASTATAATQFAAYSTISSIESTTTTYSTAQTITTYTNLINNLEDFAISTTPCSARSRRRQGV